MPTALHDRRTATIGLGKAGAREGLDAEGTCQDHSDLRIIAGRGRRGGARDQARRGVLGRGRAIQVYKGTQLHQLTSMRVDALVRAQIVVGDDLFMMWVVGLERPSNGKLFTKIDR